MLTIVFLSFHSEHHIKRHILEIDKKFPIIIVDNARNFEFKKEIEEKYSHVKIIIPKENLGWAAGMNLGIKDSKTDYVMINSPDINITNHSIDKLYIEAKKIKNFALFAPTYLDETIHKNFYKKLDETDGFKNILEVEWIDNSFIINKKEIENIGYFDENFFMYFENLDFCKRIFDNKKKMLVSKNIKFTHEGTCSVNKSFSLEVTLSRNWHYSWSKFFFFKKHYGFFFALRKIFPNFLRSVKKIIIYKFLLRDSLKFQFALAEFKGILNSVLSKPSNFRPFEKIN
ncbi:glycosyltransferase [Candidatus Fonsibacter ubiquis]|uniref:glycosyltransferase n=1 Tax=Candidatus Fonsibacter ubiquis TaxID=1925548 RepID=UPI000C06E49D|nr:glycosyltransferase [Candidatus Fonsibacter ubiquis]